MELSVVTPCRDEVETLRSCIREARSYLGRSEVRGGTVIGESGSTDGSQGIAKELAARALQDLKSRVCEEVKEESGRVKPVQAHSLAS